MTRTSSVGKITLLAKYSRVDLCVSWWTNELMQTDIERVLFDEPAINRRLDELAQQISNDYRDRELTVLDHGARRAGADGEDAALRRGDHRGELADAVHAEV